MENLAGFLEAFSDDQKKLGEAPTAKGAPHTLIVAAAGLRAADLVRCVTCTGIWRLRPCILSIPQVSEEVSEAGESCGEIGEQPGMNSPGP